MNSALAVFAHPDDIEFVAAGTLLLLRQRGWEIHYLHLSTGNCGSTQLGPAATRRVRRREARAAARILGAHFHPPWCDDLEILYDVKTLRRVAAVVRATRARIVLTHSPQDYMEDHSTTCRLAVTAAFAHRMPNFRTVPARRPYGHDVTVYHAQPHGGCDPLRRRVAPGAYVQTTAVHATKLRALAAHRSQQDWLAASQGMNSYLQAMDDQSRALGKRSRRFQHAEGWRRHSAQGFGTPGADPLREALGRDYRVNRADEATRDPAG